MNRRLTTFALGVLSLAALAGDVRAQGSGLTVSAGDVTDRRRNDGSFSELEVELKVAGAAAAGAQAVRASVRKAVDDTGRNLIPERASAPEFSSSTGMGDGAPSASLKLRNPARRAKSLSEVSGQVDVFVPSRDPSAIARVDRFAASMDRPIAAPALKTAGSVVTVISRKTYEAEKKKNEEARKKEAESAGVAGAVANAFAGLFEGFFGDIGENDVLLRVEDKGKKLFEAEVLDASGKKIDGMGTMKIGDFWIMKFAEKLPADASLRLYVLTPKAVLSAPFSLKNVALP